MRARVGALRFRDWLHGLHDALRFVGSNAPDTSTDTGTMWSTVVATPRQPGLRS